MNEFTGDYEKCNACGYVWDFMESHCPECGSQDFEEINAKEVREHYKMVGELEKSRMEKMLELHDD